MNLTEQQMHDVCEEIDDYLADLTQQLDMPVLSTCSVIMARMFKMAEAVGKEEEFRDLLYYVADQEMPKARRASLTLISGGKDTKQ